MQEENGDVNCCDPENAALTMDFAATVLSTRKQIKGIATQVKTIKELQSQCECAQSEDRGEVMANLMLAYRHLEDASMRLGKVLQAYDGGVSVYDRETTVGA